MFDGKIDIPASRWRCVGVLSDGSVSMLPARPSKHKKFPQSVTVCAGFDPLHHLHPLVEASNQASHQVGRLFGATELMSVGTR